MSNIYHVIKDPVHGSLQFTSQENNWIKPFIECANFQRLRHIKQLGLTDLIFPGAVHTRFSHCLGAAYIASQISKKLDLPPEEKQLVIIACLLHDIGHGPFSHVFEEIFYEHSIQHEMWTPVFLAEYTTPDFLDSFNRQNPDFPLTKEKIDLIQDLITHHAEGNELLSEIVSSQLDADRLDYLLRDSHFCGVTYGEYDYRWLLHCLTVIEKNNKPHLGITRKGVGVVEQYLMARRLMKRNVYQHGKKYATEFLLQEFLKRLGKAINIDDQFLNLEDSALIKFLRSVKAFNQVARKTNNLAALKHVFIHENYGLYKQLCDYDVWALIRSIANWDVHHPVVDLAKRLHLRKLPRAIQVNEKQVTTVKKEVELFKSKYQNRIQDWQMTLLTLPHLSYEVKQDPILVQDYAGTVKYLHDDSLMISAISDKNENLYMISIDIEIANEIWMDEFYRKLQ